MRTFEFYRSKSWFDNIPPSVDDRINFYIGGKEAVVIDYLKNGEIEIRINTNFDTREFMYTEVDFDELGMYRSQKPKKIIEAIFKR